MYGQRKWATESGQRLHTSGRQAQEPILTSGEPLTDGGLDVLCQHPPPPPVPVNYAGLESL